MKMQNTIFKADPKWYLSQMTLENPLATGRPAANSFDATITHKTVYLDIRPVGEAKTGQHKHAQAIYSTSPTIRTDEDLIVGSFIPYQPEGTVAQSPNKLGRIALPSAPGPNERFVFTGAMNGCSFVLAKDNNGVQYAVHYPNSKGASTGFPLLGKCNLKKERSADHLEYGDDAAASAAGPSAFSNAFCLLYHTGTDWKILCQPQVVRPIAQAPFFVPEINHAKGSVLER